MIQNKPCLEINAFGYPIGRNPIVLEFQKNKCLIDLHLFFEDFFSYRDRFYGNPEYERHTEIGESVFYQFSLVELAETFLGVFTPENFAGFLEKLLIRDESSQDLVEAVRGFEKNNKIAFPSGYGNRWYLLPFNLTKKELDEAIRSTIPKSYLPKKRHCRIFAYNNRDDVAVPKAKDFSRTEDFSRPIYATRRYRGKEQLGWLREHFLEMSPKIIMPLPTAGSVRELDFFAMIKEYPVDTNHLTLTRIRQKKI